MKRYAFIRAPRGEPSSVNLIKMFQSDTLSKAVAAALLNVTDADGQSGDHVDDAMSEIDDFLRNFQSTSVSTVGTDANAARDPLAGDWRIDDAHGEVLRIIKTPEAYRVEMFEHAKHTESADATKDPDSVACVATFFDRTGCTVFKAFLAPMSNQVLGVIFDHGHGDFERVSADRLFPD